MTKQEFLDRLYDKYRDEFKGQEIVSGDGNPDTKLVLVGEAPGKDEVRLSKPFVGMAGKNLNEFLDILGIERQQIYITNAIKYRLSEINPKTGKLVNRPAKKEEIEINRGFLLEEICIIRPEYLVTLGNVPLKAVTGDNNAVIGSIHGQLASLKIAGEEYKLFPLYHPASVIYNRSLKDVYLNDIKKLGAVIKINPK
jgi:DNA polymerase